jgi:hypothetical protein
VYVVARTVIAGALLLLVARRRAPGALAAQAVSDAVAALLVLAYAGYALRAALGGLTVLLFVYFVVWEVIAATRRFNAMGDAVDEAWSDAELLGGTARWAWDVLGVAPAFLVGALVAGSIVLPGQWTLPGTPPPLTCAPTELGSGDTLMLRMRTPHGGELGAFTPRRGYYNLRSTPRAGTVPDADRFARQDRLVIPTTSVTGRQVFTDSGTYMFSLSEYKDVSMSVTCAVRYRP